MKSLLTCAFLCFVNTLIFGQVEVTPQALEKINAGIEKQILLFKKTLPQKTMNAEEIEFAIDTFRIERMQIERMDLDFSTFGMNDAMEERTTSYDKLMNRYYNKLLKLLEPADKKVLIITQKAWLAFRDAETKLIWTMTKDQYSGGGTMQTGIATSAIGELVVRRVIRIFGYYDTIISNK